MGLIIVGNSYSQATGLTGNEYKSLRKILSYVKDPKAAYYSRGFARPQYLIDKKGYFPTGLLKRVQTHLKCPIKDLRVMPKPSKNRVKLNLGPLKPYPDQILAKDAAIAHHRGGLSVATGVGKTLIMALIIQSLQVKTLIVVPSLELKLQLKESMERWFGKTNLIHIENIDSKALKTLKGFDCLLIDESHHSAAKTYRRLNRTVWKDIYYRFFLTATFFRNQDHEELVFEGIAGNLIYKLGLKEAIKKGYICPVEAYYYDLPRVETKGYSWTQVYSERVTNNVSRNELIKELLVKLNSAQKYTLCLVREIAHGNVLAESGIPFANGQDEETRAYIKEFKSGRIKSLIGTTGIVGEGIDVKSCEYVIITGLGKAKSAFLQQIGRAIRISPGKESGKIILFRDKSHKFCLQHFNAQVKILKEELGIIPVKLESL